MFARICYALSEDTVEENAKHERYDSIWILEAPCSAVEGSDLQSGFIKFMNESKGYLGEITRDCLFRRWKDYHGKS